MCCHDSTVLSAPVHREALSASAFNSMPTFLGASALDSFQLSGKYKYNADRCRPHVVLSTLNGFGHCLALVHTRPPQKHRGQNQSTDRARGFSRYNCSAVAGACNLQCCRRCGGAAQADQQKRGSHFESVLGAARSRSRNRNMTPQSRPLPRLNADLRLFAAVQLLSRQLDAARRPKPDARITRATPAAGTAAAPFGADGPQSQQLERLAPAQPSHRGL